MAEQCRTQPAAAAPTHKAHKEKLAAFSCCCLLLLLSTLIAPQPSRTPATPYHMYTNITALSTADYHSTTAPSDSSSTVRVLYVCNVQCHTTARYHIIPQSSPLAGSRLPTPLHLPAPHHSTLRPFYCHSSVVDNDSNHHHIRPSYIGHSLGRLQSERRRGRVLRLWLLYGLLLLYRHRGYNQLLLLTAVLLSIEQCLFQPIHPLVSLLSVLCL